MRIHALIYCGGEQLSSKATIWKQTNRKNINYYIVEQMYLFIVVSTYTKKHTTKQTTGLLGIM